MYNVKNQNVWPNRTQTAKYRGFTLIELLVVVLIIGILAAVALPQYRVAVAKSRMAAMLALGKSLADAQEAYYLANGEYASRVSNLDVDMPTECRRISNPDASSSETFACYNYIFLDNGVNFYSWNNIRISYCPNNNQSWAACQPAQDMSLRLYLLKPTNQYAGKRVCSVHGNSKLGKAMCAGFGGFTNS